MAHVKKSGIRNPKDRRLDIQTELEKAPRILPAMPLRIGFSPISTVVSYERGADEILFRFRKPESQTQLPKFEIDPYSIRETFENVQTPGEAFELLRLTGIFRWGTDNFPTDTARFILTWSEFQDWQRFVRRVRTEKLDLDDPDILSPEHAEFLHWPRVAIRQAVIPSNPDGRTELEACISAICTIEAIAATIQVDQLVGVEYRACALTDCRRLYEVRSNHERQYCDTPCAHKASVRRRRAAAKALKAKKSKSIKKKEA
jgi:hypothetical protein